MILSGLFSCSQDPIVINNAIIYLVHESCYSFGTIEGQQWQPVYVGEYSSEVVAVPKTGYRFLRWSDGLKSARRKDLAEPKNSDGPLLFYAYFELNDATSSS